LFSGGALLSNDRNKVQSSFLMSFDQCALPCNHWLPFTRISQDSCQPLLLSEAQANEFKSLFERITIELGTHYVFKNEYLISLLKIIILLMDKISQRHAAA
jgi:formate-dependent phosphoribosylglycinamide formyltransferase (GAR transformylase)